jgi:hypothetical protein
MCAVRGRFLTSPLGVKFDLQGRSYPLGAKTLCSPLHSSKEKSVFTPGVERKDEHSTKGSNFAPGGQVHPWRQTHVVKNRPQYST